MASDFSFDLKKSSINQAVIWEEWPTFRFVRIINRFFLVASFIFFVIFIFGLFGENASTKSLSRILGTGIILLIVSLFYWWKEFLMDFKLKKPRLRSSILVSQMEILKDAVSYPENYNLAEFLSFEAAKAINASSDNSTNIFYNLLRQNPQLNFVFGRALINIEEIKKVLRSFQAKDPSADFPELIIDSLKIAAEKNHIRIEAGDILMSLAIHEPVFKKVLLTANLKKEDIENLTRWLEFLEEKIEERKRFWEWRNMVKNGSLAKAWSAGYTITLDSFSVDISEIVKNKNFPEIIGHHKEIEAMERVLARKEVNNALVVGEPGSGRKSMIEALAIKSMLGQSLPETNYKRVVQLDLISVLSQNADFQTSEALLDQIFQEIVQAGNIILVIDEFHNFVGGGGQLAAMDISGVLSRYLHFPQFKLVAITSFEGLHRNIEQNPSILSLFEKIEVSEISEEETLTLLERQGLMLEHKYKRFVSYPALRDIIVFAGKYFQTTPFPEKAIDLLNEAMVYIAQKKDKILLPENIAEIVSEKTQIPVGDMAKKEKETLLDLENLIHQRIINQEEAVQEVSAALRRARAEVEIRKGTMGSFLFLGPTGVGKTETAKALAEIYFGSEARMIRLDMSEFQNLADIPRLIGSPGQEGLLTTKVRENPFSLILLDEIEKAHLNILNLFLQVLDEGYLTDGVGRKTDFKSSIIIATSNAGYQVILDAIKSNIEWGEVKQKIFDYVFSESIFRPEFINRFDGVIIFRPLSKKNLLDIAELMLEKLKKNLKEKEIDFLITEPLKEKMVELGYDPVFGARQMQRTIQDKVENILASAILSGRIKKGDMIEIDSDFQLKIK